MRIVQIVPASGTTLRGPTFASEGCQKEKIKKLEIYLKKIVKENFLNLVKEIDIQVQEAQRVPIWWIKEAHSKTLHY